METIEGGEIAFRDFPPGVAAAEEIIAITRAAVRVAAEAPDGLRYYAFAIPKTAALDGLSARSCRQCRQVVSCMLLRLRFVPDEVTGAPPRSP